MLQNEISEIFYFSTWKKKKTTLTLYWEQGKKKLSKRNSTTAKIYNLANIKTRGKKVQKQNGHKRMKQTCYCVLFRWPSIEW